MKYISISDLQGAEHLVNKNFITRVQLSKDGTTVFVSDGFGIKTKMSMSQLKSLIED